MAKLFLLFLFVPLIEIYFLIEIGSALGAGLTIAIIMLTALMGAALVRYQGLMTLTRAQKEMLNNRMPAMEVLEGGMILLAGVMLLIPGFFTDALGFLLLIPPLRQFLAQSFFKSRVVSNKMPGPSQNKTIIDIDYQDIDHQDTNKP